MKKYPAEKEATVRTGAWNVASTSGYDFTQWNGSESQKRAIEELIKTSGRYWELKKSGMSKEKEKKLERARKIILEAETSCYLFWGETWIPKMYERINAVKELLQ